MNHINEEQLLFPRTRHFFFIFIRFTEQGYSLQRLDEKMSAAASIHVMHFRTSGRLFSFVVTQWQDIY